MPPKATPSKRRKKVRGYRRLLSKHRMKLSIYKLNGMTQSSGTAAMFCEM